jgi:hypothetical protein
MRIQRDKFVRPFARLSHRNPFQTPCPALRLCLISNRTDQTPGGMGSGLTACALGKAARERATCKTTTPPTIGTRMPRQDIPTP